MARQFLHEVPDIHTGLTTLLQDDPVFKLWELTPEDFERPLYESGYPGFARIVIGQQVSTHAAQSLWSKFTAAIEDVTPSAILNMPDNSLRSIGLSRQKARYLKEMARQILCHPLSPDELSSLPDEDVAKAITDVKGFGPWSAEIYLMFCLGRPDVWPAKDLGVQEGLKLYHGLEERPDANQTLHMGHAFKPYRTSAAILLWHLKALGQVS